jgi:PAS domain S-box-containing protein
LTQHSTVSLEDLRLAPAPAWLWDAERARLVWANAAGVALFGGENVFDLVDRPFDRKEDGIARLASLIHVLELGQSSNVDLRFPSLGLDQAIIGRCSLHPLADGRHGVLMVAEAPRKAISDLPSDLAGSALASLAIPLLIVDGAGSILHANAAAKAMLDLHAVQSLKHVFARESDAQDLVERLLQVDMTSSILNVASLYGQREVRVTLAKLASTNNLSVLLEDITDRRALERSLAALSSSVPPAPKSPQEAFAQLAKSLQETMAEPAPRAAALAGPSHHTPGPADISAAPAVGSRGVTAGNAPLEQPKRGATMKSTDNGQANTPFVPQPVRSSLENTGQAVVIGRGDRAFFATVKAANLLGYLSADALLADQALWKHLRAPTVPPNQTTVPLPDGGSVALGLTPGTIPWLNGPADQIILKPLATKPETLSAAAPAAAQAAAMGTAPVAVTPGTGASVPVADMSPPTHHISDQIIEAGELKAMLDVASDGIIALDAKGAIMSFSAGAQSIFGVTASDVKGRSLAELLAPESRKPLKDYLAALNGPGLASVFNDGREFTALVKQGGEVPLFVTLGKLQSPHSKAAFCAVVRDVTPWKRTERELREAKESAEQASKQKSDFLAGISHEIRTPLNAILGFSEVMRLERFGEIKNEKYRAYANDIHTSGTHLLALVNDLLDLSKIEAGKLELDFTAVNVADAVEHTLRLMQDEATRSGIVMRKSLANGLPRVVADLRALNQILLNLVSNAVKYSSRGDQVIISAQLDKAGELLLRVKDTGAGMTETQLHEALQPYSRIKATSRGQKGTGLGLPLSKALVEANRARFALTSVAGEGTVAEIRFPATRVLAE